MNIAILGTGNRSKGGQIPLGEFCDWTIKQHLCAGTHEDIPVFLPNDREGAAGIEANKNLKPSKSSEKQQINSNSSKQKKDTAGANDVMHC